MIVQTGGEKEEEINETVKAGRMQGRDRYKYVGTTISTNGQLTEDIKELNTSDIIIRKTYAVGPKI